MRGPQGRGAPSSERLRGLFLRSEEKWANLLWRFSGTSNAKALATGHFAEDYIAGNAGDNWKGVCGMRGWKKVLPMH